MALQINGVSYSLSHLSKFERKIDVPLKGGFTKKILVEFRFSPHCYSRGLSEGEVMPAGMKVADGARDRVFDLRRYNLSFNLVASIDALIAAQGDVHKSRHDNFFRIDNLEETLDGVVTPISYYIFMSAEKESEPNKEKRIRIYVESAYPLLANVPAPHSKRVLPFVEVLGKIWAP
ncbi:MULTISPECIES: hypothetical protein [unclassified Polaromonas]|uniref:hypothetical protein n=1 Tax=unclassified Polaromonas TaxID=2638319 RepID=UPI000F08BD28|nr:MULTISPECIES: hypothetical protein [unclassified Polaromonas]AYQ27467.1 hypothetical protein DT070_05135 [Polaromonas sp. SP1]QGJ17693.1 hypothetical protein F7R28_04315 [Polaromonas sp. Pch-P]